MTYRMDVEAWTDVAYQLSPQEFKVYFCISMMIAQNDGTLVRDDRALARACNDPGKTLRSRPLPQTIEQTATGRLSGNDPGRQARQSASARSSSATRATTVGMSATRLHAATAIACRSDLPAAVALSS